MFVGMLECDLLLGDVHSLKEKRAILRPLLAHLRKLEVSVSEVGDADLHRRVVVGVAVASGKPSVAERVLDECERIIADDVECELLSVRRRMINIDDLATHVTER
ncbi:MAG: DUF503 domain-containing protein [Nakamurella sp.]